MWNQDLFKQKTHARREEVISKEMIEAIKGFNSRTNKGVC
jgi:hypothetical protein